MSVFSNVLNSVMSSIPTTEAYALKVRRIDNPGKAYRGWPLVKESGLIKVYQDVKNKQFEGVLYTSTADGHETTVYSLFKISKEPKAIEEFTFLCSKLEPFLGLYCRCYNAEILQRLCTQLRVHPDWSPAHIAIVARFKEVLRLPAIIKFMNSQQCELKRTPLHLAVQANNNTLVSELISCHARVDLPDEDKETVLHYAARLKDGAATMIGMIPMELADINCLNKYNQTALNVACQADNFDVAEMLIKVGANLSVGDDLGFPIHYAMKKQQLSMVHAIFEAHKEAGTAKCNKHGATPLHWAKTGPMLRVALQYAHEIDAVSKTGDTALHVMVKRLRNDCSQILLLWGADPNIRGQGGDTPLHVAARHNNLDLVNSLIVFGADINIKNIKGETPRHIAATQMASTFQKFIGVSSNVVYSLHLVGAERCAPEMQGCKDGCRANGAYNGKPQEEETDTTLALTDSEKVYDDFLALTVGLLASFGSESQTGVDEMDSGMESPDGDTQKARRKDTVLCLDGGGIRGLILIQLLEAIERVAGCKLVDLFDWITGTSTGGILAIALTYGYSIRECRRIYFSLKDEVFVGSRPYKSENLERLMKECFGEHSTMDSITGTKMFITGTLSDRSPPALHLFRNFDPPDCSSAKSAAYAPQYKPPPEPKDQLIWRAGRSSGAAPTYFPPMGRFLDGGLIANNPTLDTLTEITEYYMDKKMKGEEEREIGVVVSLGTGVPPNKDISHVNVVKPQDLGVKELYNAARSIVGAANLGEILIEQVCDTRCRAVDRSRAWCHTIGAAFFRFSPPLTVDTGLDETRNAELTKMLFETQVYIFQNQEKIQQLASLLKSL